MPILSIICYDFQLESVMFYPNFWILEDVCHNQYYLTLRNYIDKNIVINKVPFWKTTY